MGFHALAIDQRSGGERWGYENETVNKLGESTKYLAALPDLEAALKWKADGGYGGKTLVWGSSYSAALVFLLAAEHDGDRRRPLLLTRRVPGHANRRGAQGRGKVSKPVLVLTPGGRARARRSRWSTPIPGEDKRFVVIPERGRARLFDARSRAQPGRRAIWPEVQAFLERFKG